MTEEEFNAALSRYEHMIPPYMIGGLRRYVCHNIKPGDFQLRLLENDFMAAAARADDQNSACLFQWAIVIENVVPSHMRGSPSNVQHHLERRITTP